MSRRKEILVTAFALFSLFFGAGNLILPAQLGFKAGDLWWLVALGFALSAVVIPILGIIAHARIQGTMFDFANKVSPGFSLTYCFFVYAISIGLPSPRTASVTHEMAIAPLFNSSPWITSSIYFLLVFIFTLNRSKILDVIGKLMTPAIFIILLAIIGVVVFAEPFVFEASSIANPLSYAVVEGYQTFDAIGAVVVGGVIIISINLKNANASYGDKKSLIIKAGLISGLALFLIYTGLLFSGAIMGDTFPEDISRTDLLRNISSIALGDAGKTVFAILVSLACFTTAVGIITGTADFVKSRFPDSKHAYTLTAFIGSLLGVLMGQLEVSYIIAVALPALMFIYPITIVLILLNVLPNKLTPSFVFKSVVVATLVFSIPDFLGSIGYGNALGTINNYIPFSEVSMGWIFPALLAFIIANVVSALKPAHEI